MTAHRPPIVSLVDYGARREIPSGAEIRALTADRVAAWRASKDATPLAEEWARVLRKCGPSSAGGTEPGRGAAPVAVARPFPPGGDGPSSEPGARGVGSAMGVDPFRESLAPPAASTRAASASGAALRRSGPENGFGHTRGLITRPRAARRLLRGVVPLAVAALSWSWLACFSVKWAAIVGLAAAIALAFAGCLYGIAEGGE